MILVTRIPQEGQPFKMAVNPANLVEVTPNGANQSWMKYWDGERIRSCIIEESPEHFIKE